MPKAVTLDEFRTRVRFLGHFENSTKISDARLDEVINNALESVWGALVRCRPDAYVKEGTSAATSGAVPLASDFFQLRMVCWIDPSGRYVRAEPHDLRDMPRLSQYSVGDRYWYRFQAATPPNLGPILYIVPAPPASVSWRVFYIPSCPTLVAGSDSWDAINGYEDAVIAASICDLKGRDGMPLDPWDGRLAKAMAEIESTAGDMDSDEPFYLSPAPQLTSSTADDVDTFEVW